MSTRIDEPAPPRPRDGGGGSEWVLLTRARDDIDANLLTGKLNDSGIATHMLKDRTGILDYLHGGSNPWAPVTVFVRRFQLHEARLVLAEMSLEAAPLGHAFAARRPGAWAGSIRWWVAALVVASILSAILLQELAR